MSARPDRIPTLERDSYQRAARTLLNHRLITAVYPDRSALPSIRLWATELREDLLELCGLRLEVTETTARVLPRADRLDVSRPQRSPAERVFDRRRYAYLALVLAALGRSGTQITLTELADTVAADASVIDGVHLSIDRAADRDGFVDAVGWLAARGAISLADGDAGRWAADPSEGEALYDIDRSVIGALFRPGKVLQHLGGVGDLLGDPEAHAETQTETRRRVRRRLVDDPVVYYDELDEAAAAALRDGETAEEIAELTGLAVERRAEGVALIDGTSRMSDVRFPGTGTVAQVALLLAGELAERVLDQEAPALPESPVGADGTARRVAEIDSALPRAGTLAELAFEARGDTHDGDTGAGPALRAPAVPREWVDDTMSRLHAHYGFTFAAQWRADPQRLTDEVLAMLQRLRLVDLHRDGVLVLPALARYRGVVVQVRGADAGSLFEGAAG